MSQLPIIQHCGDSRIDMSQQKIHRLLKLNLLKPEDSMLHWELFRPNEDVPNLSADHRRALFYPSAGKDFLFPLLVGLPYCTDFFFYEEVRRSDGARKLDIAVRELLPRSSRREVEVADGHCVEFDFDSVSRRAWIVHQDNLDFLKKDIPLAFYFHRGDSPGEGGSGQLWDSELLPQLLQKADRKIGCHILTDGEPGGLLESVAVKCQKVSPPNSHRRRDYFYGVVRD